MVVPPAHTHVLRSNVVRKRASKNKSFRTKSKNEPLCALCFIFGWRRMRGTLLTKTQTNTYTRRKHLNTIIIWTELRYYNRSSNNSNNNSNFDHFNTIVTKQSWFLASLKVNWGAVTARNDSVWKTYFRVGFNRICYYIYAIFCRSYG